MKPYSEYKNSNFEFLGNIPSPWNVKRAKYVYSEVKEPSSDGSELLLSVSEYYGVKPRSQVMGDDDFVTRAETLEGYKKCQSGDLVMNIMLAWKTGLGVSDFDGIVSPSYAVFRPINDVHSKYFHYLLRTNFYVSEFRRNSTGIIASRLRLYPDDFLRIPILLPSLSEQQAIADFLDCKIAQIDMLIEKKQRQIDLLQEQRTALINQAVTKGLNPNVSMKDSGVEWLGERPSHWEVKRLRRYKVLVQTGPFGSQLHSIDYVPNGYPVVNPANMVNGSIIPDENKQVSFEKRQELSQHILQKRDIVFARRGELGRAVLVTEKEEGWLCGTGSILIRFFEERLRSDYLSYYLQLPSLRDYFLSESVGSTMDNLNSQILLAMPLLEPPSNEQAEIVDYVGNVREKARQSIENISKEIGLLQEYRTALISEAVTGKIDVREWRTIHE